jgi:hypothetical protein
MSIDIIYPEELKDISPSSFYLCEAFVSILIKSKCDFIRIKINTGLCLIECNDLDVKNYFYILLKSLHLDEFYCQFKSLLHQHPDNTEKVYFLCRQNGVDIKFELTELTAKPEFYWLIKPYLTF